MANFFVIFFFKQKNQKECLEQGITKSLHLNIQVRCVVFLSKCFIFHVKGEEEDKHLSECADRRYVKRMLTEVVLMLRIKVKATRKVRKERSSYRDDNTDK